MHTLKQWRNEHQNFSNIVNTDLYIELRDVIRHDMMISDNDDEYDDA